MIRLVRSSIIALTCASLATLASAQNPTITKVQDGRLTFTNVNPTLEYQLNWSTGAGGYRSGYHQLYNITPTNTVAMSVELPLTFNVVAVQPLSNNIARVNDQPYTLHAGTNTKFTVVWSDGPQGPWYTNWNESGTLASTGSLMTIQTPRYFQVFFINCRSNFAYCGNTENEWYDATDGVNPTNAFGFGEYYKPCIKIRMGQTVIFSGNFINYPLRAACQECAAIQDTSLYNGALPFVFNQPGYYGYFANGFGDGNGDGMAGNIWVIP